MNRGRAELFLAWVLSALVLLPLLRLDVIPTMDGFHHVLHGVIGNQYGDYARGYHLFLEPGAPITSLGFGWIFNPLEPLVGWQAAYMTVLAVSALGWSWAVRALIRTIAQSPTPLGLLGFCFAFTWPLYMGFLPFCISGAIGIAAIALSAGQHERTALHYVALGALLLLSALAHVFPAAICGVAALTLAVASVDERRIYEAGRLVLCGTPAALIALLVFGAGAENIASQGADANSLFWQPWGHRIADLGRTSIAGPTWRSLPIVLAAVAGPLFALRRRPNSLVLPAALIALLLLASGLAAPLHMTAWEYFSPRALLFGLALGLGALAAVLPARVDRPALVLCLILASASILWAHRHNSDLDRAGSLAFSGLEADIAPDGWRLPIVFDVYGGVSPEAIVYAKPLTNFALAYAAEQGGAIPYLFASSPDIHPYVFREGLGGIEVPDRSYYDLLSNPEWADPRRSDALRMSLLHAAAGYEDVIVFGDPGTIELLDSRGFEFDHREETLAIAQFRGCEFRIRTPHREGGRGLLQWGWFPLDEEAGRVPLEQVSTGLGRGSYRFPAHSEPDELLDLERSPARTDQRFQATATLPCGSTWLRLALHANGSTFVCDGSMPDGRFVLNVTDGMEFECLLRPHTTPTESN